MHSKSVCRVEEIEVSVGDRLKWTKNQAMLSRRNGQEFEVCDITDGQILIRYSNGKTESLSHSELLHLDYALVNTTYGAQGKSAERVIGALDQHVGRESFYVTVSRVKHDLRLYASEPLDQLINRAEKFKAKENPYEFLPLEFTKSLKFTRHNYHFKVASSWSCNLPETNHETRLAQVSDLEYLQKEQTGNEL